MERNNGNKIAEREILREETIQADLMTVLSIVCGVTIAPMEGIAGLMGFMLRKDETSEKWIVSHLGECRSDLERQFPELARPEMISERKYIRDVVYSLGNAGLSERIIGKAKEDLFKGWLDRMAEAYGSAFLVRRVI